MLIIGNLPFSDLCASTSISLFRSSFHFIAFVFFTSFDVGVNYTRLFLFVSCFQSFVSRHNTRIENWRKKNYWLKRNGIRSLKLKKKCQEMKSIKAETKNLSMRAILCVLHLAISLIDGIRYVIGFCCYCKLYSF